MKRRWNTYSDYLEKHYGERVYRVSVDAGLSCPHRKADGSGGCAFCDGSGAQAVHLRMDDREKTTSDTILLTKTVNIDEQIERGLRFIRYRYKAKKAMLYFQAWSNTNASTAELKALYDRALSKTDFVSLIVSTRPDLICDDTVELLASYITPGRAVWVELGLQSANDETLKKINRGHEAACYADAVKRLHSKGIKVCTHVMLLPCYEERADYLETIKLVNRVKSEGVKIHQLCLNWGTSLISDYKSLGCYPISSAVRHVEDVAFLLAHLDESIIVERLNAEMPKQRLAAPHFPDKRDLLFMIDSYMEKKGWIQGCLA